ncbi:peroxiredoxin, partial [Paraburkholderia sp. BR14427]
MTKIDQVLFSGNSHATVNRDPDAQSGEYGVYDLKLTAPGVEDLDYIGTEPHP